MHQVGRAHDRTVDGVRRFRDRIVTADAVYGVILFAALIGVADEADDDFAGIVVTIGEGLDTPAELAPPTGSSPLEVLLIAAASLLVFWLAHVYARTIAGHGVRHGEEVPLRTALRRALRASNGMLLASIPSAIVLIVSAITGFRDGPDWAVIVAIAVLMVLGYQAFAERAASFGWRLAGALGSAVLGLFIVILDVAAH